MEDAGVSARAAIQAGIWAGYVTSAAALDRLVEFSRRRLVTDRIREEVAQISGVV